MRIRLYVHNRPTEYGGELGASFFPVNVDATGYSTKTLDSQTMKSSILYLVKKDGWNATSVSVSKSSSSGLFYISVVVKAIRNTADELEKIKQGVWNVLSTVLPLSSIQASFAGAAAQSFNNNNSSQSQSAQTKQVTLVGVGTLKTYSEPSSFELKVSNELTGLGWTVTGTSLKNAVNLADRTQWLRFTSPLFGYVAPTWNYSINISINALAGHNTEEIKNRVAGYLAQYFSDLKLAVAGQTFDNGTSPGSGLNLGLPPLPAGNFLETLAATLGVSTPIAIVGGALLFILISRR